MILYKAKYVAKLLLIFIIISLLTNCSEKENRESEDIKNKLYSFHSKDYETIDLARDLEIIIVKRIDVNFRGIFYKIKDTHYYGFIGNSDNIISVKKLKFGEYHSVYDKNQCFVQLTNDRKTIKPQKEDFCFTLFIGEIPKGNYSKIEIDWNCSEKSSEELVNGKYFFFFRKNAGDEICNLKVKKKNGDVEDIVYNNFSQTFEFENNT